MDEMIEMLVALERPISGGQRVEDDAQRKQIGARVGRFALGLLGDTYATVPKIRPSVVASAVATTGMAIFSSWPSGTPPRGMASGERTARPLPSRGTLRRPHSRRRRS